MVACRASGRGRARPGVAGPGEGSRGGAGPSRRGWCDNRRDVRTDGRSPEEVSHPAPGLPPVRDLDRATLRLLMGHEARLHAIAGRELRDLGDALLLLDRRDAEPYWNRLVAPEWPEERAGFARAVDNTITIFATLGRIPHIWPYPSRNQPRDIVDRLWAAGFEVMGSDHLMVLGDSVPAIRLALQPLPPGVTVERLHRVTGASLDAAPGIARVLAEAFAVDDERRSSIELETLGSLEGSVLHVVLVRVNGEPAAVAKRSTQDGISYLSSIGTRPRLRRRGLGGLATAIATADAIEAGSTWTYLKVDTANLDAQRLYGALGYVRVPGQVDDLLLRR